MKKKHKNERRRLSRGFLYRLASTFLAGAFIPLLLFSWFFVNSAYTEIIEQNDKYYRTLAVGMRESFCEQLTAMKETSSRMASEKLLYRSTIEDHPYNNIVAIENLKTYRSRVFSSQEICVHYQNADYVLSSMGKYSYEFFLTRFFDNDGSKRDQLRATMLHTEGVTFLSEFDTNNFSSAKMIVAIPSTRNTIVTYIITRDSFDTYFLGSFNKDVYGLMILSENNELIYDSRGFYDSISAKDLADGINTLKFTYGEEEYTAYISDDHYNKLRFVVSVPDWEINQSKANFYNHLKKILLTTGLVFLVVFVLVIYVNYKPILTIKRGLEKDVSFIPDRQVRNEIDEIGYALSKFKQENDEMSQTIDEHQEMVRGFVFANLLDGRSVTKEQEEYLLSARGSAPWCIVAVGLPIGSNFRKKDLEEEIRRSFGNDLFMSDVDSINAIFVLLPVTEKDKQDRLEQLQRVVQRYAEGKDYRIGVGITVKNPEEIRTSYLGALSALEASYDGKTVLYESLVDGYDATEEEYAYAVLKFLQYVRLGDAVSACDQLDTVADCMHAGAKSRSREKYLCSNLVCEYIKLIPRLGASLSGEELNALMMFSNFDELKTELRESLEKICGFVCEQKEREKSSIAESIVNYVNNNFVDSELSLIKLSDVFDMSIYAISRSFKEQTGIGYKEYVTAKRIELSKKLLLTTSKSVSKIAEITGFTDLSGFSRTFKNICGVSPNKFRE